MNLWFDCGCLSILVITVNSGFFWPHIIYFLVSPISLRCDWFSISLFLYDVIEDQVKHTSIMYCTKLPINKIILILGVCNVV